MAKNLILWVVIAVVLMTVFNNFSTTHNKAQSISYSEFINQVKSGGVKKVSITNGREIEGIFSSGQHFSTYSPGDEGLIGDLLNNNVEILAKPPEKPSLLMNILINWFPLFVLIGLWIFFMRQMQGGGAGRGAMSFGKSKARMLTEDQVKVTFNDVAGVEEAKEEVTEMVDFLRDPSKFQKLGGKIPKGVLMVVSPVPARPCWPRPSPARPKSPSSPSRAPTSSRCSSASAPRGYGTCSSRPRSTPPASSSSTRSMRWAATAAPVWGVGTTSVSRPSTSCWWRWMASRVTRG